MNVTRDVVLDILPLYFAGQVSADTRALVDEFLRADPDFARMSSRFDALLQERGQAPEETERHAFQRTRRLLRYRNQLIGFAAAFTMLPFSFVFRGGRLEFLLYRDWPTAAALFGFYAIGCWIAVYLLGRRSSL
jgi:hypothetical protein